MTDPRPHPADPPGGTILVVDDEEHICEILAAALRPIAKTVLTAASAKEAGYHLLEENIDIILCDIQMPGMSGLDFLKQAKEEHPDLKFVMVTAHGSLDRAILAMRYGASDFITKPFENAHIRDTCRRLMREVHGRSEPLREPSSSPEIAGILGDSVVFRKCLDIAMRAASSDSSVLIMGESGTGKEVLANAIHRNSSRMGAAFIAINCGAIPENLLESELFGYARGAFTGAAESKPGKFALAHEGTVFLDEIGELPTTMQVKLLRTLQEKKVDPVGSQAPVSVDFRLIAATNRDLAAEVESGNFREDLFYRLNVIPIVLPPLRERGQDVILLARHFLDHFNHRFSTGYSLEPGHENQLLEYQWPGNIRELENLLERSVVLSDGKHLSITLPTTPSRRPDSTSALRDGRKFQEKTSILKALESNRWNKTRTAEVLGISRRSLLYKVKEYGIS